MHVIIYKPIFVSDKLVHYIHNIYHVVSELFEFFTKLGKSPHCQINRDMVSWPNWGGDWSKICKIYLKCILDRSYINSNEFIMSETFICIRERYLHHRTKFQLIWYQNKCMLPMSVFTGVCSDGHQYNDSSHLCDPCPIGFYKNNAVHGYLAPCQPCPLLSSTNSTGATNADNCISGRISLTDNTGHFANGIKLSNQYLGNAVVVGYFHMTSQFIIQGNGGNFINHRELWH